MTEGCNGRVLFGNPAPERVNVRIKLSEGVSEPSRTHLIWAGQICGRCDAPLGDRPVIRVRGSYLGLSYLGTDQWGAKQSVARATRDETRSCGPASTASAQPGSSRSIDTVSSSVPISVAPETTPDAVARSGSIEMIRRDERFREVCWAWGRPSPPASEQRLATSRRRRVVEPVKGPASWRRFCGCAYPDKP